MSKARIREPIQPFARFRVYPDRARRFFFYILVFPTKARMYRFYQEGVHGFPGSKHCDFHAITLPYRYAVGSKEKKREIGTVLLYRARTGATVVAHEMTHAACHYMQIKKGGYPTERTEEEFARVVGSMTGQFFRRY